MIRSALSVALLFSLAVAAVVLVPSQALAQKAKEDQAAARSDPDKYFEHFPYGKKILDSDDQPFLNDDYGDDQTYAEYARAVIFGRHGRVFVDPDIKEILSHFKWYKPNPAFSNKMLNANERSNLDIVRGIEAKKHANPQPGDMRWWRSKYVLKDMLTHDTVVQLHVMRTEIEAIHGKTFPEEPLIQKYFDERYWYKGASHYDPKKLNDYERANISELAKAEAKKTGEGLAPGSLLAYGEKPILPEMLKGSNLYDLRLLRNEIYAIRGGRFHTKWIQDHFDTQDWYTALPKGQEPKLSSIDEKNVAVILNKENEIHLALSTTKLKPALLEGMLSDDAGRLQNEIYARRGKVFKDKWLQSYFASMPWYKANASYSDKLLNPIERANLHTIALYEKEARTTEESMAEG